MPGQRESLIEGDRSRNAYYLVWGEEGVDAPPNQNHILLHFTTEALAA